MKDAALVFFRKNHAFNLDPVNSNYSGTVVLSFRK